MANSKLILIVNCGSSSLKYALMRMPERKTLGKGLVERIGLEMGHLEQKADDKVYELSQKIENHKVAMQLVMKALTDPEKGFIKDTKEIAAVGHRVLHGGQHYYDSIVINEDVKKAIRDCFELGPLHNPANLMGIEACEAAMPGLPNVAVFDTAFGMSMPEKAYIYAIPHEYYEKYGIRRYGFHGTSHKFVSNEAISYANLDPKTARVIVCHLGNGASISASIGGKCIDTSMGLTPLEGLIMGTRSGDVDPAVLQFIMNKENLSIDQMLNILNKKSGVLGMTKGVSSDFRDVGKAKDSGNHLAEVALDAFVYRVVKYVGAYVAAMKGVDAICFCAGVGENDKAVRKQVCDHLGYLGVKIDNEANNVRGVKRIISAPDSKVKVILLPTNEELQIAIDTFQLTDK